MRSEKPALQLRPEDFDNPVSSGASQRLSDGQGNEQWMLGDQLHREDGPAVIWSDGTRKWYQHGELHREDGPAVEWGPGRDQEDGWFLHGKSKTQEEVEAYARNKAHFAAAAARPGAGAPPATVEEGMALGTTRRLVTPKTASFKKIQP